MATVERVPPKTPEPTYNIIGMTEEQAIHVLHFLGMARGPSPRPTTEIYTDLMDLVGFERFASLETDLGLAHC